MNIVSLMTNFLTPDMIGRIASALGLDKSLVGKAIGAAVPTLLAALTNLVSKPDGAGQLSQALAQQKPDLLGSIGNLLGGTEQKGLLEGGLSSLTSLLGGSAVNSLTGALGKFAGLNQGGASNLLGVLGPVVMGTLGKQQKESGLDAAGLANLLTSQKDNVASALPSGFGSLVSGSGLLDSLGSAVSSGAATAQRTATQAAHAAEVAAERASSGSRWLWPVLILAAIALAAWYLLSDRRPQQAVDTARTAVTSTIDSLKGVMVGGADLSTTVSNTVGAIRSSLEGIKDPATAQASLPKLSEAAGQLDKLVAATSQLSPNVRSALAMAIAAIRPTLDQLADKALAIPGVGSVVKPAIDAIRAKLDVLARA